MRRRDLYRLCRHAIDMTSQSRKPFGRWSMVNGLCYMNKALVLFGEAIEDVVGILEAGNGLLPAPFLLFVRVRDALGRQRIVLLPQLLEFLAELVVFDDGFFLAFSIAHCLDLLLLAVQRSLGLLKLYGELLTLRRAKLALRLVLSLCRLQLIDQLGDQISHVIECILVRRLSDGPAAHLMSHAAAAQPRQAKDQQNGRDLHHTVPRSRWE
mmetsp:Transcript_13185/g.31457  ORF Transcript_13185/g.31457 Transcript_13185/m.31457 type:complete len:211 (+) Transcript_13185:912-1544(+)